MSKFIRLGVSDKNEHAPYFEKGVFEVDIEENKEANNPVLTVAAKDRKDCEYAIVFNNKLHQRILFR